MFEHLTINHPSLVFTFTPEPEHLSIEESFDDPRCIEYVRELDTYTEWGWCTVKCAVTVKGVPGIEGTDYLGCCSYDGEDDFLKGGYAEQMKADALEELVTKLTDTFRSLEKLSA